jgi:ABC-2 type transport system ATP-binding protein
MITIRDLCKAYGRARVLDGLNLDARPGQVTLLVGANGTGKTTLLKQVCGLSKPDAGRILIAGVDIATARRSALAGLAYLPQSPRFHPRLTVGEILDFYAALRGLGRDRARAAEAHWRLTDVREQATGRLSGGTRQRLALAVQSLPEAPVLVLDEPGLSLDPDWRRFLHAELRDTAKRGATVLVATHLLGEWDGQADRCLVLEEGSVARELPASRLRDAFPFSLPSMARPRAV